MQSLLARRCLGAFLPLLLCAGFPFPVSAQAPAVGRPATITTPVESGYLGLIGDDRVTSGRGVQILSVRGRGAAEAAGLRTGDTIVAINRQQVNTVVQMAQQLTGVPAGGKIDIEFDRDGKRYSVPVTLGPRPAADGNAPPPNPTLLSPPGSIQPLTTTSSKSSLGVRDLSPLEGARRGYVVYVRQGALIEHIEPNSPADRFGLSLGAVIVAVDGKRIDDAVDLAKAVAAVRPGDVTEVSYYRGEQLYRKQMRLTPVAVQAPQVGAPGEIVPKVTEFPPSAEGANPRPRVPPPPPRPGNPLPMGTTPAAPMPLDPFLPPPAPTELPAPAAAPTVPLDPLLPPPVKAPVAPPVAAPADPLIVAKPPLGPNPLPPSVLELDRKLTDPPIAKPAEPLLPAKSSELARLKAELADTVHRITGLQKEQQTLLQTLEKLQKSIEDLEKNGEK